MRIRIPSPPRTRPRIWTSRVLCAALAIGAALGVLRLDGHARSEAPDGPAVTASPPAPIVAPEGDPQDRQSRRRGDRQRGGERSGGDGGGDGGGSTEGSGQGGATGQDGAPAGAASAKKKEDPITLARLFPEKSFFGPSASSTAISFDGRYGAFLYRPYIERRHGSDLWIHDFESGETSRITMVSVMSEHQDEARKVRDDRVKKGLEEKKRLGGAKPAAAAATGRDGDGAAQRVDGASSAPPTHADAVSGTWDGRLLAEGIELLPPEGIAFSIEVLLGEDGAVSGVVKAAGMTLPMTEGRWEPERKLLSFVLRPEQPPITARVEATLEDERAEGTILVDAMGLALRFEASRLPPTGADGGATGGADGEIVQSSEVVQSSETPPDDGILRFTARNLGDWVGEKDADDERAPRYPGISSFEWSPTANEMIFVSQGDLFRCSFVDGPTGRIARLTRTRESESDVQWLPDGTGYTYLRSGGGGRDLIRVRFDDGALEQINPTLTGGESMSSYRLSPDGRRLVFIATRNEGQPNPRRVNIVNYRDRFAQVSQVPRTVSDDPQPEVHQAVYLYDLDGHEAERGLLKQVYARKQTGPRDALVLPRWSPDSSRVAFAVFDQASGRVDIMEASFVAKPEEPAKAEPSSRPGENSASESGGGAAGTAVVSAQGDGSVEGEDAGATTTEATTATPPTAPRSLADLAEPPKDPKPAFEIRDARPVYRFLHNGGPNTPRLIEPQYLDDSRRLVFITELSGFRQLHVLDPIYENLEPLTRGRFEVYPFAMSKDHRRIYALSTKDDPAQQHVFAIDVEDGSMARLTTREGFHDGAAVSEDGLRVLALHSDFGSLRELYAIQVDRENGELAGRRLTDSHPDEARKLTRAVPEYFSYRNRHGQTIHGHMFKPDDWTPQDRRPLLIYVYGGPLGQRKMAFRGATDAASYFFAWYMATVHGYVTCTIDPRGASGYGGLFEKSNFEQVGKPQVEDLVDGAKWMTEHHGVDPKRVGIHGWSFGGFQTQMCLYTEPDVFAVGIAGAGPTEWENYNAWYSTGTIGPSRQGQTDLAKFSLLPLAKNLKGRLLLVHGVEDSNVLYQDTVRVYRELLKAGKEHLVDLFIDPTGGHGLGGDVKTIGRYRKYEDFLLLHLGKGEAAKSTEASAETSIENAEEAGDGAAASPPKAAVEANGERAGEDAIRLSARPQPE
ncbi:MAG TPA: prolyl oligopeptidase family serine peptidase [Phycisphaerales bacterium]|nr:prolyl oligopeptidase family serine peptidase [Phycisphaerales bacterium]HMP38611.1 prolyl oligopeptidase family serine peptidase [Phycisphaerales bacterium]